MNIKHEFAIKKLTTINEVNRVLLERRIGQQEKIFDEITKDLLTETDRAHRFKRMFALFFFGTILICLIITLIFAFTNDSLIPTVSSAATGIGGSAILQAMYLMFSKQSDIRIIGLEADRKSTRENIEKMLEQLMRILSEEQTQLMDYIINVKDKGHNDTKSAKE